MTALASSYGPSPCGPARGKKSVYVTQHVYFLADTMSDTGTCNPCRVPLTGTDGGSTGLGIFGAVQADS